MGEAQRRKSDAGGGLAGMQPLPDRGPARGPSAAGPPPPPADTGRQEGRPKDSRPPPSVLNSIRAGADEAGSSEGHPVPPVLGEGNAATNRVILSKWLTEEYLGPALHGRLAARPPRTLTESPGYFARFEREMGAQSSGVHIWGTSDIHVSSAIRRKDDLYGLMAHEDLHYVADLGGGLEVRLRGADGSVRSLGHVKWFHEGMTELHAQQLAREHGMEPLLVTYPCETASSLYIQKMTGSAVRDDARGREIVRGAYLSGDFTEVSALVDMELGPGTFGSFLSQPNGAEAYRFIRSRLGSKCMGSGASSGFASWEDDPLLSGLPRVPARFRPSSGRPGAGQ